MKKALTLLIAIAAATVALAKNEASVSITVKTSKVCRMLVQTWADAYMRDNPNTHIAVVDLRAEQPSDLVVDADDGKGADGSNPSATVARYLLLPVTTQENPVADDLRKRQLSQYDLQQLYFTREPYAEEDDEELSAKSKRLIESVTVYSGNRQNSAAEHFARLFGHKPSDLRGRRISGDDIYLLSAIERDSTGITVGNVAYLYDTAKRSLREGLLVLPLKLSKEQRQAIDSRNLDQLLAAFEHADSKILPAQRLELAFTGNRSAAATDFAQWVQTAGQQYNNRAGFLRSGRGASSSATQEDASIVASAK